MIIAASLSWYNLETRKSCLRGLTQCSTMSYDFPQNLESLKLRILHWNFDSLNQSETKPSILKGIRSRILKIRVTIPTNLYHDLRIDFKFDVNIDHEYQKWKEQVKISVALFLKPDFIRKYRGICMHGIESWQACKIPIHFLLIFLLLETTL